MNGRGRQVSGSLTRSLLTPIAVEKLPGLSHTRESVLEEAEKIGPAMTQMVEELLTHPILDQLYTA
jgi:hypothetical protein